MVLAPSIDNVIFNMAAMISLSLSSLNSPAALIKSTWEKLVLPGLTLDGMTHEVSCSGRKVSLTRLEFDLLLMLASHEGQIFSKEELFRAVWGQNCDDTLKVVANTVSNLRKKLAGCGSFIRTTHGGYAFVSQKENDPA